jgi:hypothetical protein
MKRIITNFIAIAISVFYLQAQTGKEVRNIDFTVINDTMVILYDFANSSEQDIFTVSVSVKTINGKVFNPKTITGDVGNNVKGGRDKRIVWNVAKDNISLDEEGFIEITATIKIKKPITADNNIVEKDNKDKSPVVNQNIQSSTKTTSTGKAILLSTVMPGLGNSKLSEGKPYWIIGVASYSCLAGGIITSISSSSALKNYNSAATEESRDSYYTKSENNANLSTYLFIGAGVLWVGDLIFTAVQGSSNKKETAMNKRIVFGYGYDVAVNKPVMTIGLKF